MNKQGSIFLLLALIVTLPGCWNKDGMKKDVAKKPKMGMGGKKYDKNMGRKMVQANAEEGSTLADASNAIADESLKSFFDEMDEFVAFTDAADELGLDEKGDEYAWQEADEDKLESVYFGFDKAKVDEDQDNKIRVNADRAQQLLADARDVDPDAKLVVEGYADHAAGKIWYNKQISEKRAEAVATKLVENGVARDSIKVVGRGTQDPVSEGSREEQWLNRRVQMHVA